MTIKPIQDFWMRDENGRNTAAAKYIQGQLVFEVGNAPRLPQTTAHYLPYQPTMSVEQYLEALEARIAALENP